MASPERGRTPQSGPEPMLFLLWSGFKSEWGHWDLGVGLALRGSRWFHLPQGCLRHSSAAPPNPASPCPPGKVGGGRGSCIRCAPSHSVPSPQ